MTTVRANIVSKIIRQSRMAALDCGEGEAVVLAHGYLCDAEMWRPQIRALARRYRVIIPELWGHGQSGRLPRGTLGLRDVAQHHLELLDELGIDRFALIGHSAGGMWGAELACWAPERVSAICLMSSFVGPEPEQSRYRYSPCWIRSRRPVRFPRRCWMRRFPSTFPRA
jgi:pimeloyl-ACP methyl ester carboxylesterase